MSSKDCENVTIGIVEDFIKEGLVDEKRRAELVQKLKSGVIKSEDWVVLAELRSKVSGNV